ncbi:MAG: ATP-dependent helicase, partial [Bacteroidia bacterium]|nr:ATP-dependent helicase [Bacteroidia bacterium]
MNFEDEYKRLNTNQKQAVEAIEGCVMVVAGPGTGKTQVLGARIANILKKTDTNPENILCLTFTEAASTALRKRLYAFIGSESYKVNIYTYHGFCNMVIQENADHFGMQDLQPVSDLEVVEILKEMVDELSNSSKLKRFTGDVYFDIRNLKKLFSLLKKDNLSSENIADRVSSKLQEYKTSEDFFYKRKSGNNQKGDFNTRKFNEHKEPLEKLVEAAALIKIYNSKLKLRKRYDFDDMLAWVLNAFSTNHELLLKYQETYQYFLVDEYQDTNGIQNDLLYTLINYWDNPNVFVVGDDDQSIYKFQGANVENIFEFYAKYKSVVQLVVLEQNYRSAQGILDGSNTLIKKNVERLVGKVPNLNKEIVASNEDVSELKDSLKIVEYPNTYQEIVGITSKLKKLKLKGQALNEVGVLYRNHRQSEELIKYLESENISYNVSRTQNVLEVPIIKQLNTFLEYLKLESKSLESGQHLLFDILHFNNFKHLSAFDIAKIGVLLKKLRNEGWRSKLIESGEELDISKEAKQELLQFVNDVEYWLKEMHNLTLQSLVERVMSKMGFVSRALSSNDATFQIQCLKTYYNFLKEETGRQPFISLDEFLHKIELLIQNKIGLILNKIVHGVDGVNLMTVHGSKGLEFDYVYLLGCTDKKWEKDRNDLPYRLNHIIAGEPKEAAVEEARRLFYVALTRARKGIEISYALKDEKDKDQTKSLYVAELEESM